MSDFYRFGRVLLLLSFFCYAHIFSWQGESDFEQMPLTESEINAIVSRYDEVLRERREAGEHIGSQPAYNAQPNRSTPSNHNTPPSDTSASGSMVRYGAAGRAASPFGGRYSSTRNEPRISDSLYQGSAQQSAAYYRFTTSPNPLAILSEYKPQEKHCPLCQRQFGTEFSFCPFCAQPLSAQVTADSQNKLVLNFVTIPAGAFYMGGNAKDSSHRPNERYRRPVKISLAFEISTTEVTQKQWQLVMGYYESEWEGDDLPVQRISWDEIQTFLQKLNEAQAEYDFRLPTEAEWEYAAHGGTDEPYCFGADTKELSEYAWFIGNSSRRPQVVASKKPNAYGLYDMHGNVWEWVQDWYQEEFPAQPAINPQGPVSGKEKVYKGGGWASTTSCRAASRAALDPQYSMDEVGFRIVREARSGR